MKHVKVFVQPHRAADLLHRLAAASFDRGQPVRRVRSWREGLGDCKNGSGAMSTGIPPRSGRAGNG
jgi:hypothetical protein